MRHKKDGENRHKRPKPVKIPLSVNTYDELVYAAKTGNEDAKKVVKRLDETMDRFNVPSASRREVGNLIERFSVMLNEQDERVQIVLRDDPTIHNLLGMVEFFRSLKWV